jgi:hypothetical protein
LNPLESGADSVRNLSDDDFLMLPSFNALLSNKFKEHVGKTRQAQAERKYIAKVNPKDLVW